jgi:hypothetical protein
MMNRWKASGIHLLISILVVGSILLALLFTWYPPAIMGISKADKLIYLLAGVDIVIGPLLTLIVFKTGKPSLKFDLSVIALLQICALSFGLYTIWQSRPVFMVAADDRFYLVFANEIDPVALSLAKEKEYSSLSLTGAKLVSASAPVDLSKTISFGSVPDIQNQPRFFARYDQYAATLIEKSLPVVADKNNATPKSVTFALKAWADKDGIKAEKLRYVPVNSSRGSGIMVMDITSKKPLGAINVNPWGIEPTFK